ncbi:MAG: 4-hydroxy-3-methylbut-2-enyl diphosphate reductase [Holosporales bacterium]|jgi:4-hydroxy-3-methylbut-2-enyl diphosphate reductase|nr:4-hydroxy-3-methylbut-2-enyl diphosphate reductase [Holosporales bacterium]
MICYLLSPRGFCSGVTRAVNMANQVLKLYGSVYITEDIIHNEIFMKNLKRAGVIKVSSIDDVPDGSAVMISVHGVSPKIIEKAENKQLTIIDGTCPIVESVQKAVRKASQEGKKIIIIGNRTHPEIIAILGYAYNKDSFVVYNELDVDLLPDFVGEEVVYFTQTTLNCYSVRSIIKKIVEKIPHIQSISENNICYAIKQRQYTIDEISNAMDLVIIVGSAYSANSTRLSEIAKNAGAKKVIQIDDKNCLDLKIFKDVKKFAIASGTSTPEAVIDDLVNFLKDNINVIFEEYRAI